MTNKTIITCHIFGGLGNQLFQIFTTFAVASRYGLIPVFSKIRDLGNNRHTYWDSFLDALEPFLLEPVEYSLLLSTPNKVYEHKESGSPQDFSPIFLPIEDRYDIYLLHGYFQNILYFQDEFNQISSLLRIPEKISHIPRIKTSIGIHFRLGDYKNLQHIHPILPDSYYIEQLSEIPMDESTNIVYFCEDEDVNTVSERMKTIIGNRRCSYKRLKMSTDWEELLAMATCEHLIIANSTFSWWANEFRTKLK